MIYIFSVRNKMANNRNNEVCSQIIDCNNCNNCNKCANKKPTGVIICADNCADHHSLLSELSDSGELSDIYEKRDEEKDDLESVLDELKYIPKKHYPNAKKFVITLGDKQNHPLNEYNKGNLAFYVNGKAGPVLKLNKGYKYYFIFKSENKNFDFILTNSPSGGRNAKPAVKGFNKLNNGVMSIFVDDSTPKYFYYQDANSEFKGGLIIVK